MAKPLKKLNKYNAPSFLKQWNPNLKRSSFSTLRSTHQRAISFKSLKEDDFALEFIAPLDGIENSSLSEGNNTRGLKEFLQVFQKLYAQTKKEKVPIGFYINRSIPQKTLLRDGNET